MIIHLSEQCAEGWHLACDDANCWCECHGEQPWDEGGES